MADPYLIVLTEERRTKLRDRVGSGVAPARMLTRARILLQEGRPWRGRSWLVRRDPTPVSADPPSRQHPKSAGPTRRGRSVCPDDRRDSAKWCRRANGRW